MRRPTDSRLWPWLSAPPASSSASPPTDPIVGLLITVAILAVLRTEVRDVYRRIMDAVDPELVDPELVDQAEDALRTTPGILEVRAVRLRWIGHRLHAEAELDVDSRITVADAHRLALAAERSLTQELPRLADRDDPDAPHRSRARGRSMREGPT